MPNIKQAVPKQQGPSSPDSCIAELIESLVNAVERKANAPTTADAAVFLTRLKNLANVQGVSARLPNMPNAATFVAQVKAADSAGDVSVATPPNLAGATIQASGHARILRVKDLVKRIGISRASLYVLMKDPTFVRKIQLTARTVGFLESEVNEWIEARAAARNIAKEAA
ncbi:helix-turn-helix transcriptional regulator [Paraburkholderia sp. BCC1885]|uniref:helix-turn-helix transcriptional regulator n=1 Tax=Paraburkholderia sp. BCC1885 TaxID=2562669 RepID=UPI0021B1A37E|nr:AlpA family transcriptional regulator [Paraburkholderia sp. BCC1885]